MEKEFIPYEQAVALKELGFDESCIAFYFLNREEQSEYESKYKLNKEELIYAEEGGFWYNSNSEEDRISAPLYQQCWRWFREKYGLWQIVMQNTDKDWTYDIMTIIGMTDYKIFDVFDTYEETELECLKKLIEIVKL